MSQNRKSLETLQSKKKKSTLKRSTCECQVFFCLTCTTYSYECYSASVQIKLCFKPPPFVVLSPIESFGNPISKQVWFFRNHWNQRVGRCLWGWDSIKQRKVPEGFYVVHYLKPNNGYFKHISLFQGEKVQVNLKQGFF